MKNNNADEETRGRNGKVNAASRGMEKLAKPLRL